MIVKRLAIAFTCICLALWGASAGLRYLSLSPVIDCQDQAESQDPLILAVENQEAHDLTAALQSDAVKTKGIRTLGVVGRRAKFIFDNPTNSVVTFQQSQVTEQLLLHWWAQIYQHYHPESNDRVSVYVVDDRGFPYGPPDSSGIAEDCPPPLSI